MKALTVRQPWASLIAAGVKRHETRSWSTEHRGWLAIHAATRFPLDARRRVTRDVLDALDVLPLGLGRVVALVRVVNVTRHESSEPPSWLAPRERAYTAFRRGVYVWHLEEPVPVWGQPMHGAQGLWDWEPAYVNLRDVAALPLHLGRP